MFNELEKIFLNYIFGVSVGKDVGKFVSYILLVRGRLVKIIF